jgi:hypothetical protein
LTRYVYVLFVRIFASEGMCLASRCLATTIHVTVLIMHLWRYFQAKILHPYGNLSIRKRFHVPVTVAARPRAWTVFARSDAVIVGSNPTQGMDVGVWMRLFCVCVVLCIGTDHATGWSPVQVVLPPEYKIKKLNSGQGPTKGCRDIKKSISCNWFYCPSKNISTVMIKRKVNNKIWNTCSYYQPCCIKLQWWIY